MEEIKNLILVANPGSASRKYALYEGDKCLAKIHFEFEDGEIIYTFERPNHPPISGPAKLSDMELAATKVWYFMQAYCGPLLVEQVKAIALRIVAPSSFFQQDRLLHSEALAKLADLEPRAPLHIRITLAEAKRLSDVFPGAKLIGISDSAFHITKPPYASDYAIPISIGSHMDVHRYGYHGISAESVVRNLKQADKLPARLVICHLGSGASITAVQDGKSLGNSMGYSPLSGLMMATRTGDLDIAAALALKTGLDLNDHQLQIFLNEQGGLLGVSGSSSDIRQLLKLERQGHDKAALALRMYVYHVCQGIGQMAASLGGVDGLVFTGIVGERSREMRRRIVSRLLYLGFSLDAKANHELAKLGEIIQISPPHQPAKIYVVQSDEAGQMALRASHLI